MPKYLLLKHYRGGPEPHRPAPPMDQWAPEDVEAHMAFQHHVSELLEENALVAAKNTSIRNIVDEQLDALEAVRRGIDVVEGDVQAEFKVSPSLHLSIHISIAEPAAAIDVSAPTSLLASSPRLACAPIVHPTNEPATAQL